MCKILAALWNLVFFRLRTFNVGKFTFTFPWYNDRHEIITGDLLRLAGTYQLEIQFMVALKTVIGHEIMTWLSLNGWWLTRIVIQLSVSTPYPTANPSVQPATSGSTQHRCQTSSHPLTCTCTEKLKITGQCSTELILCCTISFKMNSFVYVSVCTYVRAAGTWIITICYGQYINHWNPGGYCMYNHF
jgi:hypothetical protein